MRSAMKTDKISIICDGSEVAFGLILIQLFKFENDGVVTKCKKYRNTEVEIYTIKVFNQANKHRESLNIFIGKIAQSSGMKIYDKYGMKIFFENGAFSCLADPRSLGDKDYLDFLCFSNHLRSMYLANEKTYSNYVLDINANWIIREFKPISSERIMENKKSLKQKQQQLYDCIALLLFNEILDKEY